MTLKRRWLWICALGLALCGWGAPSRGAGLGTYENGSPDQGRAAAGRAAAAEDASTAWGNPAGMVLLREPEYVSGANAMFFDVKFDPDGRTDVDGGAGGNAGGFLPALGSFFVQPINDRLAIGTSMTGLMGAGLGYDEDWAGRYYSQEFSLMAVGFSPSVAFRVADWFSVGATATIGYARVSAETMLNNGGDVVGDTLADTIDNLQGMLDGLPGWGIGWLPGGGPGGGIFDRAGDIREKITDLAGALERAEEVVSSDDNYDDGLVEISDDAWGVGASIGVLVQPGRNVRVGVVYRSPIEFTFKDTLRVTGRGAVMEALADALDIERTDVELTLRVPQEVMASAVWHVCPAFALMGNIGWQNWEDVGDMKISVDAARDVETSSEIPMLDTWHFAVGTRFRPCRRLAASLGWAYDTSALELDARGPALPVDRHIRYSAGIEYDWKEDVTLGLNYTLLDMGRNSLDVRSNSLTGHVSGAYDKAYAHIVGVNLRWRF